MATSTEQPTTYAAPSAGSAMKDKDDEELARRIKRANLKTLNLEHLGEGMAYSCWALP